MVIFERLHNASGIRQASESMKQLFKLLGLGIYKSMGRSAKVTKVLASIGS
jgi:hypothetical protein